MALGASNLSTWGWPQNSLLTIDEKSGTITRNPEYYVMRHYSSAVRPGAVVLGVDGRFSSQGSAYRNPDGSLAVVVQNALERPEPFTFTNPANAAENFSALLEPRSLHTFVVSH
uniref:CAZy families GH30 protein n=1 Tax=uncultured Sanguibacter sp. TaxID=435288 RepID=A0A060C4F0_9MICO|nr:CAZy families GH30 protein [uncultured Sanguibacter sp.]